MEMTVLLPCKPFSYIYDVLDLEEAGSGIVDLCTKTLLFNMAAHFQMLDMAGLGRRPIVRTYFNQI